MDADHPETFLRIKKLQGSLVFQAEVGHLLIEARILINPEILDFPSLPLS